MLVPITKTIWRGEVGTHDFGVCNVIVTMTSFPIRSIYCIICCFILEETHVPYGRLRCIVITLYRHTLKGDCVPTTSYDVRNMLALQMWSHLWETRVDLFVSVVRRACELVGEVLNMCVCRRC